MPLIWRGRIACPGKWQRLPADPARLFISLPVYRNDQVVSLTIQSMNMPFPPVIGKATIQGHS
jgi:hypothetical protein